MAPADVDVVARTSARYPCRALQIQSIAYLLGLGYGPTNVVVHGLEATGKSSIVKDILAANQVEHAIIQCLECVTARHLFERIVNSCFDTVKKHYQDDPIRKQYPRSENATALASNLQRILGEKGRFILVLDDIDRQKEASMTLLPALARLGEVVSGTIPQHPAIDADELDQVPGLTVIFIVQSPGPRFLQTTGTPHVHFPSYLRDEVLEIVSRDPRPIFPASSSTTNITSESEQDSAWLWERYCGVVWDSQGRDAARDIVSFQSLTQRLWEPFVESIRDGTFGPRDFSKLMVAKRSLFQGESSLLDKVVPEQLVQLSRVQLEVHDLPYYTKYLICAAYLGSYNPARLDPLFFMKSTERKRRKRGGAKRGRPPKHRKIPRRLLGPSSFTLERLIGIFHAILPHATVSTAELYSQIATLTSLRLLLRPSTIGAGGIIDSSSKWRVNVTWDYAVAVARGVGFDIEEWHAE